MENDFASQTRREFFLQSVKAALLASSAGALVAFLESCSNPSGPNGGGGPSLQTIQTTATNNVISLTIDSSSPLSGVGTAALVEYQNGPVLVARTSQTAFVALTAICTHQGCTISSYSNGTYTCPCHGSQFDVNGNVVRGPASRSLVKYATSFANNVLTIAV